MEFSFKTPQKNCIFSQTTAIFIFLSRQRLFFVSPQTTSVLYFYSENGFNLFILRHQLCLISFGYWVALFLRRDDWFYISSDNIISLYLPRQHLFSFLPRQRLCFISSQTTAVFLLYSNKSWFCLNPKKTVVICFFSETATIFHLTVDKSCFFFLI